MNATMSLENTKHYPVMLNQVLSIISPQHGGTFIDCTFGGGSYSKAILKYPNTKVLALDRDNFVKGYATTLEKKYPGRFNFFQNKFSDLDKVIKSDESPKSIIFDLGLSSFQLEDKNRGFSFNSKSSVNMEMGINKYNAYDVINNLDKKYLAKIIKIFGEEKDGGKIAHKINQHRSKKPIRTSKELASIINEVKKNYNVYKKSPATKTFQAIRIFVNQELTELIMGLILASQILQVNGTLIVISFHSLEDKIVKSFFNLYSELNKNPSRYLPLKKKTSLFKILSKKPLVPNKEEIAENAKSRSAKLRYGIRNNNLFSNPEEFKKNYSNYFEMDEIRL
jgi:16S rRNA (cytosine1402-N4)-methyltransferase